MTHGARAQAGQRLDDQREPLGQVVARAAVEPHEVAVLARYDAGAVVLDLVQPRVAVRRLRPKVRRHKGPDVEDHFGFLTILMCRADRYIIDLGFAQSANLELNSTIQTSV